MEAWRCGRSHLADYGKSWLANTYNARHAFMYIMNYILYHVLGGGYQYRLCPASEDLTEECFQKHPLDFVRGHQFLQWNNGTRQLIKS